MHPLGCVLLLARDERCVAHLRDVLTLGSKQVMQLRQVGCVLVQALVVACVLRLTDCYTVYVHR